MLAGLRHSLRRKMVAGYLVIVMLTVAVGAWAITNLLDLSRALDEIMVENYRSILAAENMIEAIERQDSAVLLYLLGQESQAHELYSANESAFLSWLARAEDNVTETGEGEIVAGLRPLYGRYLAAYDELRQVNQTSGVEAARQYYLSSVWPRVEEIRSAEQKLLQTNHEAMIRRRDLATEQARRATWSTAVVAVVSVFVGLIFGYNAAEIIIGPARRLTESVKRIGAGQLNERIEVTSEDEIGQLAREFNVMAARLREVDQDNIDRLIEERTRSEAVVNSITDPLLVLDGQHRLVFVNPAAEQVFGLNEELVRGVHLLEATRDDKLFDLITTAAQRGDEAAKVTLMRKIDGKDHHFAVSVTPIPGEGISGYVVLLNDVTHYRELDQLKSDFVSTVSHEFRTPLTSIAMGVGLLLERHPNADREHQLLAAVDEDTRRLTRLVNDLLDLSRIESGRIQMEFAPVSFAELLRQAADLFRGQAESKGLKLVIDVPPELPLAWADQARISWVLSNLVDNALRYTPTGGSITLSAQAKGNRLYVSVADTGVGIPPSEHESIFRKFVQLPAPEGTSTGGAGLGLSIAREVVEAHGGRIWVESNVGAGSTFIFTLRLAPMDGDEHAKA